MVPPLADAAAVRLLVLLTEPDPVVDAEPLRLLELVGEALPPVADADPVGLGEALPVRLAVAV